MVYIIIIQARMGSTRLPGKVLKKLLDKEIILWSYDRCIKSKADEVFIATSINKENDILEELCISKGIKYYRGSEMDLLDRYYQLSKQYYEQFCVENKDIIKCKSDLKIIRITSDCPFIDNIIIDEMIDFYNNNNNKNNNKINYIINHNKDAITPEGSCVEIIDFASLEYLWNIETDIAFREHATGLLSTMNKYNDIIKIHKYAYLPDKHIIDYDKMKYIKVSIDTQIDYENALQIVNYFKNYDFTYLELLVYLQNTIK
jgi:spore coat polysaccharide biosynthesis protein SpsF